MPPADPMIEEVPASLVADPLAWFIAHHRRHRQLCRLIEDLAAEAVFDPTRIRLVLDYLKTEAPLHLLDEEEDLFPMLRARCADMDDVNPVLLQLLAEHRTDGAEAAEILGRLERCLAVAAAPGGIPETRDALTQYAAHERQHLALENAVILPIARLRLTEEDLHQLSARLGHRRAQVGKS